MRDLARVGFPGWLLFYAMNRSVQTGISATVNSMDWMTNVLDADQTSKKENENDYMGAGSTRSHQADHLPVFFMVFMPVSPPVANPY